MQHLGVFPVNGVTVWLKGDYGEHTQAIISDSQAKIDKLRRWAKALEDRAVRKAYLWWISDYQRGVDDARDELRTHRRQREYEKSNRQRESEARVAQEYADNHAIPEPPKDAG